MFFFFFSSRRRHTRCSRDWSSDVCSSDLSPPATLAIERECERDAVRPNAEEVMLRTEPEFDGIVRWPIGGERVPRGRLDRFDGRGEGETATSRDGREGGW